VLALYLVAEMAAVLVAAWLRRRRYPWIGGRSHWG